MSFRNARQRLAPWMWAALCALFVAGVARAQTDTSAAALDSASAIRQVSLRANWLSDRMPLRPGDLVTVVVDEQTAARERVSTVADGNRSTNNRLNAQLPSSTKNIAIQSGIQSNSRDVGETGHSGDLTAVLTVTVVSVEPSGALRVKGQRKVTVDGRPQTISLSGLVRAEDVDGSNRVLSSRIAEAEITYNGKKIGPRTGIIGKILGMLWP